MGFNSVRLNVVVSVGSFHAIGLLMSSATNAHKSIVCWVHGQSLSLVHDVDHDNRDYRHSVRARGLSAEYLWKNSKQE